jgi:hypothetical protein
MISRFDDGQMDRNWRESAIGLNTLDACEVHGSSMGRLGHVDGMYRPVRKAVRGALSRIAELCSG